jgi:uncharacterized protein (AIM24 family)
VLKFYYTALLSVNLQPGYELRSLLGSMVAMSGTVQMQGDVSYVIHHLIHKVIEDV